MKIYRSSEYQNTTIVVFKQEEINKIDFATCAQPRQSLEKYYNSCEDKPTFICNGGFFNMQNGEPVFNYKDDVIKALNYNANVSKGIGTINDRTELHYGDFSDKDYADFISGYPVLIVDYEPYTFLNAQEISGRARRTIMGYTDNEIVFVLIEGAGMTLKEAQKVLVSLKLKYAINLDGGGSTRAIANGQLITESRYSRAIDNVICVYENIVTLYRVQAGAFKSKTNAVRFCKTIKNLTGPMADTYSRAYVRKIGELYKVQIGAFAYKTNAEIVRQDLLEQGINAFITT